MKNRYPVSSDNCPFFVIPEKAKQTGAACALGKKIKIASEKNTNHGRWWVLTEAGNLRSTNNLPDEVNGCAIPPLNFEDAW